MSFSIIIPAFNEENYLSRTLDHINQAVVYLKDKVDRTVEIIVVDNNSTDQTASLARALWRISQAASDPACAGGSADADYQSVCLSLRLYLERTRHRPPHCSTQR